MSEQTNLIGQWLSRFGKRLLLLGATFLMIAIVLEVGTRLFTETPAPLLVKDPVIGKRYRRSYDGVVYVPEAGRNIRLRFNRLGFRGPDVPTEKSGGIRRVAVLGDSFIASVGVDEEDTLVSRLEQMLSESNPEYKWEVMNFGVAGSSPGQEIALYRAVVREFAPDVVLCAFFAGNDLADNCRRLSANNRIYFDFNESGTYQQLPYSARQAGFSQILNRYSRFYVWQKHAMKKVRDSTRESMNVVPPGAWIYCAQAPDDVEYAWRLAEASITTLKNEVTQDGAEFATVLLPSSEQIYLDRWESLASMDPQGRRFDPGNPERRLGEICHRIEVSLVTMTSDFLAEAPSRLSSRPEEWLFHQGAGHFNEKGNEVAAAAVHDYLCRRAEQVAMANSASHQR